MNTQSSRIRGLLPVALLFALLAFPEANAQKSRGGHSGGRVERAPHVNAPRQSYKAPRMPRAMAPCARNGARAQTRVGNAQAPAYNTQARATNAQTRSIHAQSYTNLATAAARRQATTGTLNASRTSVANTTGTTASSLAPNRYTYGMGNNARGYRAYGYGSGYRNRSYGRGYGYGRSQGYNRALIGRLRSVHANLARIDHDYAGHRARAMHAISMAIRQLTHRSMVYNGVGFASGMNSGRGMGMGRAGLGAGGRTSKLSRMPQAQSDARMSQALRTLQGINMQLNNQGTNTSGHAWVGGHIQRAIQELNVALSIR